MPRELTPQRRREMILGQFGWALVVIAVVWGLYVLSLFGIQVTSRGRRIVNSISGHSVDANQYFWIAVVVTPLGLLWGWYQSWRMLRLARVGVEARATIVRVRSIPLTGMSRVDYEYTCNGKRVRKAMSCAPDDAEEYQLGEQTLILLCDPNRPKRSMPFENVFFGVTPELAPKGPRLDLTDLEVPDDERPPPLSGTKA